MSEESNAVVDEIEKQDEVTSTPEAEGVDSIRQTEYIRAVRDSEKAVDDAEVELSAAKSRASNCKKDFDDAVEDMRRIIRTGPNAQMKLEFNDDGTGEAAGDEPDGDYVETVDWEWVRVDDEDSGISAAGAKILAENGIVTFGDLGKYINEGKELIAMTGVGPIMAAQIAETLHEVIKQSEVKNGLS